MGLVGDLMRKNTGYDVWALEPAPASGSGSGNQDEVAQPLPLPPPPPHAGHVCAEELNNLSVLLPCKRKGGKLYLGAYAISVKGEKTIYICVCVHVHVAGVCVRVCIIAGGVVVVHEQGEGPNLTAHRHGTT
jgi:hypothetical protein